MTKLTKEELDRRTNHMVDLAGKDEKWKNWLPLEIKQLIKDVVESIVPEPKDQMSQSTLDDESRCRFYRYGGYNFAIDTIQKNLEELLGPADGKGRI